MKKEDTVKLYIEQFLEGKSEERKKEFRSRSIERQYASIMTWKHRNSDLISSDSYTDILQNIRELKKNIVKMPVISDKELVKLKKEIMELTSSINEYERLRNEMEIKALEAEQQRLSLRIAQLRGDK